MEAHVDGQRRRSGRAVAAVFGTLFLAATAYYLLVTPGMEESNGAMAGMDGGAAPMVMALEPQAFAEGLREDGAFVANVHVPAGERIPGTDVAIPFDDIVGADALPRDKDTPILLYCETGRMSIKAARSLVREGYTDVSHLAGGLVAWRLAGLPLEDG